MKDELISVTEAAHEVRLVSIRLALLHLAYAETLMRSMGEQTGRSLVLKAIKEYGRMIGNQVREAVMRQGLPLLPENYGKGESRDLPRFGMHGSVEEIEVGGENRIRVHGCVLAEVWKAYGKERLGRLYCYVDPAKYMSFNLEYKLAHIKTVLEGEPYCEFCIRRTTEQEKELFLSEEEEWIRVDSC